MQNNGKFIPIGLQVRHAVIDIIYRNPHVSVMIPSALQLAKQFNLSRGTVTAELKKLTIEGWISGKPGIGTFTNPEKLNFYQNGEQSRIIGMLHADTWLLFADYTTWALLSYIGMALIPDIGYPRYVTLASHDTDNICKELKSSHLDGIAWVFPDPELLEVSTRLRKEKFPVVTLCTKAPGVPAILCNHEKIGAEIVELLWDQGRKNVFWCLGNDPSSHAKYEGALNFWKKHGWEPAPHLVTNSLQPHTQAEEILGRGNPPDAIFCHTEYIFTWEKILEQHGLKNRIILITNWNHIRNKKDFQGIVYRHNFQTMGEKAAEILQEMLKNPESNPPDIVVETEIKYWGQVEK